MSNQRPTGFCRRCSALPCICNVEWEVTLQPLPEEELAAIEESLRTYSAPFGAAMHTDALPRLVAEVRRLRGQAWVCGACGAEAIRREEQ